MSLFKMDDLHSVRFPNIEDGFNRLLKVCLNANRDDNILIIFDEEFESLLLSLQRVLIKEDLRSTFIVAPKWYQTAMVTGHVTGSLLELPRCFASACEEATVILHCLSPGLTTAPVREAVLKTFRRNNCRLAHIPGISAELLEILIRSPIEEILRSSDALAWAMGEAHRAVLRTYDQNGNAYELAMELDGWANEPLMSPGIIFEGSWGNIPPGEVFCCPDPRRVNGRVWIDGSLPGKKLSAKDSGMLEFSEGRAVASGPPGSAVTSFFQEQKRIAEEREDPNWNVLAELGVGLNPAIDTLSGNSLLDEKALGTIHVAIGNNRAFGHDVISQIHADLLTVRPDLLLDGLAIMSKGKLELLTIEKNRVNRTIGEVEIRPEDRLGLREAKLELRDEAVLRRLISGDRVGLVRISDRLSTSIIKELARVLPEGTRTTFGHLKNELRFEDLECALSVLAHYQVLIRE